MESSKTKKDLIKKLMTIAKEQEDAKFGKLIIQTNEVHYYLSCIVLINSALPDKDYEDYLFEASELGALINLFNAASKRLFMAGQLIPKLKKYNKNRNKLAHKMFSNKRLTEKECLGTLTEGEEIIKSLKMLIR